jgi:hypothetical protein
MIKGSTPKEIGLLFSIIRGGSAAGAGGLMPSIKKIVERASNNLNRIVIPPANYLYA